MDFSYKIFGDKKNQPFIIVHGWGGSSQSWEKVASLLSNKFYVIVVDYPCASKLLDCDKAYTLNDYADLLYQLIKKLSLNNFVLLGHSNGGALVSKFVVKYPNLKLKKLILNNSAGIRTNKKRSFKRKVFSFFAKILKPIFKISFLSGIRKIFYKLIGGQDYLDAEKNPYKKQTYLNMINSDLQNDFRQIKVDTLLIWGEKDTYTPLSDGKLIHSLIKNSKLVVLDNERHGIHLHNPERLVKTILENLN